MWRGDVWIRKCLDYSLYLVIIFNYLHASFMIFVQNIFILIKYIYYLFLFIFLFRN